MSSTEKWVDDMRRRQLDSAPVQTALGVAVIAAIVLISAMVVLHRFGIYAL